MKLGTETASVVNHLYSRMTNGQPTPEVGMGATLLSWTDRHAATIVSFDGTILGVTEDDAKRVDGLGMTDSGQRYEYTSRMDAPPYFFRFDAKKGKWRGVSRNEKGRWVWSDGRGIIIGRRDHYHDFSF